MRMQLLELYKTLEIHKLETTYTTRFHNFTHGHIPSVCDWEFVGNLFTDRIRPSDYLLSVIPHSVAISVGKKKNTYRRFYKWKVRTKKKKFPLGIYRQTILRRWNYTYRRTKSVGILVGVCLRYLPNISVCKFVSMFGN